jgi:hypothetical protein
MPNPSKKWPILSHCRFSNQFSTGGVIIPFSGFGKLRGTGKKSNFPSSSPTYSLSSSSRCVNFCSLVQYPSKSHKYSRPSSSLLVKRPMLSSLCQPTPDEHRMHYVGFHGFSVFTVFLWFQILSLSRLFCLVSGSHSLSSLKYITAVYKPLAGVKH